jgi:hypothetical protein
VKSSRMESTGIKAIEQGCFNLNEQSRARGMQEQKRESKLNLSKYYPVFQNRVILSTCRLHGLGSD